MTKSPPTTNLFRYATKELSQDAMICWLIAWAGQNKSDDLEKEQLRRCGREFVYALLNHKREREPLELKGEITTEIHQQDKSIDVLARINGQHVLLIEDKTGSGDHSGQLKRYYEHVADGNTKLGETALENIYPIYFKTGNQPLAADRRIEGEGTIEGVNGYRVFNRENFLNVLDRYEGKNSILVDFRNYLQELEDDTNGYKEWTKNGSKSWKAWEGFFRSLEAETDREDIWWSGWGYVANPSGGFLGFWWAPSGVETIYLLIENRKGKLCFRVGAEKKSKEEKRNLKWHWHKRIMEAGNRNKQQVDRPRRMSIGGHMTVGIWKEEWLAFGQDGKLDIPGTVQNLKQAESVLRDAANSE